VDLGAPVNIGGFVIEHAGEGGDDSLLNTRDVSIQISSDETNFKTVVNVTGNIQSITTHDIQPTTARFVRLNVTKPAQIASPAANIYEFQVFAPAGPASSAIASASGSAKTKERNTEK